MTYFQGPTRLRLGSTKAEIRFALSNEVDRGVSSGGVGDDARSDCRGSQFRLLWTSPSVRMGQYQVYGARDRVPSGLSIGLRGLE